jgi:hypothetical protein
MAEGNTKGEQTMTRLIDADALKEYFKTIRKYHVGKYSEWYLADVLEQQPTIDAEPVRHGKWIEYPIADGMNQCSECGVLRFGESNYCPNCGARMDEV